MSKRQTKIALGGGQPEIHWKHENVSWHKVQGLATRDLKPQVVFGYIKGN